MAVGDIASDAKGSGARYNNGKPDLSLIPISIIAATVPTSAPSDDPDAHQQRSVRAALMQLGCFQVTQDARALEIALTLLAPWWEDCAHVFEYGRKKYASWNWAKGMAWSIPLACAGRHALRIVRDGEGLDAESGLRHVGHFMANIVMLRAFVESYPEGNDLPPPALFQPQPEEGASPNVSSV